MPVDLIFKNKLRADFKKFLYVVFGYISLPNPTDIQYYIADELQYNSDDDLIIEGFRGVAKSTITGCYTGWRLYGDPENYQCLVTAASQLEASKSLQFTRNLFNIIPFLEDLKPDKSRNQRDSALQFDVSPANPRIQPSYKALGISGQLTGNRAIEIIADDIETSKNSDTEIKRAAIRKQASEFSPIVRPLRGRVIYLGTPHTEDSVYNEEREKGTRLVVYPVRYPTVEELPKYEGILSNKLYENLIENPALHGEPTDPKRFDKLTILKEEAKGKSKFQMQYMLDNTLADMDKYPLKLGDLMIMDVDKEQAPEKLIYQTSHDRIIQNLFTEGIGSDRVFYSPLIPTHVEWLPYQFKGMYIDPSGRGADETTVCVIGVLNSYIHLMRLRGLQGGYSEENLTYIAKLAKEYKVNVIKTESNFGDGMFNALLSPYLRKIYPVALEEVRNTTQKEKRIINTLEPVMNQHKLIVSKQVLDDDLNDCKKYPYDKQKLYSFKYQLTRLTPVKNCLCHDDKIDVVAMGVDDVLRFLSQDPDREIENREFEEHEAMIAEYYNQHNAKPNWYNL